MKKTRKTCSIRPLEYDRLERRNLLANDLLPDIFAWDSVENGYLHDYEVEGDLLRFSTAFANQGAGHLEVFGGDVLPNGNQEVLQRIYNDEGGHRDVVAGEFTYHPGHGHIHYDGYAIYNLREIGPAGEVGDILATGGKISFCLIDITKYDPNAGSSNYNSCGTTQGVSAGWTDVYSKGLSDQWINISGIDDGDYYLEVVTDPDNDLLESDETNNTTTIVVTIVDGPGNQGDRLEPNNSFANAFNFGMFSYRSEPGLSIHTDQDVDYYQFNAVEDGDFDIHVNFSHSLGNLDAFVYDSGYNLIASGDSLDDLEVLGFSVLAGQTYYLEVLGVGGVTNAYDLEFYGTGDLVSETVMSSDIPVDIPDATTTGTSGVVATSTLQGSDITLTDVNLIFADLQHTFLADLHFELTSPSGTTVTLIRSTQESSPGPLGSGDDFNNTVLDDQAPNGIGNGTAPYTGSYNVNYGDVSNPFAAFNGENALGTWTVSISDWYASDTGTLNAWGLMFTGVDGNPGDLLEQNDAFPQATDLGTIGVAGFNNLSIHDPSDVDFFRFNAQETTDAEIDLTFTHGQGDLDFIVYNSLLQEVARADSNSDNESLVLPVVASELYYIEVIGANGAINNYDIALDVREIETKVYSSLDTPINIFDNTTLYSVITVADLGTVSDLNVSLDITHTYVGDLDVFLNSPNGTVVELFQGIGGGGDNFTGTNLDDEAGSSVVSGSAPFTGTFRPVGSFSDFDFASITGDWTLSVHDGAGGDIGTLDNWSMTIEVAPVIPDIGLVGPVGAVTEGASGTTNATFEIRLSEPTTNIVTVDFATSNLGFANPATPGVDYVDTFGVATFNPGETSFFVDVPVMGDGFLEAVEEFSLVLSNESFNSTLVDSFFDVTIGNDDTFGNDVIVDFGTPSSPILGIGVGFGTEDYSAAIGMGWASTVDLTSAEKTVGNDLARDIAQMRSGTFSVDVPNDTYDVQIYYGVVRRRDPFRITFESDPQITEFLTFGTNVSRIYTTTVSDGQLNMAFTGAPGLDPFARIAGFKINPVAAKGRDLGGKGVKGDLYVPQMKMANTNPVKEAGAKVGAELNKGLELAGATKISNDSNVDSFFGRIANETESGAGSIVDLLDSVIDELLV